VDKVEREVTKHDVRAWVRLAQEILPSELRLWVHVPLTSYDVLDTARILQFKQAHRDVLSPRLEKVCHIFADLIERHARTLQIGRTHGQHALPITVGFWLATVAQRFNTNAIAMARAERQLVGKISGAVGAYNAQVGLGFTDPKNHHERSFEERVLRRLDLEPALASTQILPPEPLAHYLFACVATSASLGQFGRDSRHLMRSEIGEVCEEFEQGQVGSSTMAHKRNPVNFEQIEGMWLRNRSELGKVTDLLVSDHQRDLVGSSILRDLPIIVVNLTVQLETLLREGGKDKKPFLARIGIDTVACARNFNASKHLVLAEPIYIALQMAGYAGDAHELVNRVAVPLAQGDGRMLMEVVESLAESEATLHDALGRIPEEVRALLKDPSQYIGDAIERSLATAERLRNYAGNVRF